MLNIELGLAKQAVDVARRAGDAIMAIYATDFSIDTKADNSPVTRADEAAEAVILRALRGDMGGGFPVVSEEAASAGHIPAVDATPFWLVDPLDGTKEFINRNGEFTVNIALIENFTPILGVVHLPARETTYYGFHNVAIRINGDDPPEEISCRPAPAPGLTALVSRSHRTPEVDAYLKDFTIAEEIRAGSSMKFCRVAEGAADIYPRFGRTMEWDTAAGHGVLMHAGGVVQRLDGDELRYAKPGFENPHFIAAGAGVLAD